MQLCIHHISIAMKCSKLTLSELILHFDEHSTLTVMIVICIYYFFILTDEALRESIQVTDHLEVCGQILSLKILIQVFVNQFKKKGLKMVNRIAIILSLQIFKYRIQTCDLSLYASMPISIFVFLLC